MHTEYTHKYILMIYGTYHKYNFNTHKITPMCHHRIFLGCD
jgi:hypothetical protein